MSTEPILRRGDRGESVRSLQRLLADQGYDPGSADGIFGAHTEAALEKFQAANGLDVDGIAGSQTWAALTGSGEAVQPGTGIAETAQPGMGTDETVQPYTETDDTVQPDTAGTATSSEVTDWTAVADDDRMRYVMELLVGRYGYPVTGAAGIVGNLWAESAVLPNRIEGSSHDTPMRARDFAGTTVDFTAEQVKNRNKASGEGPARAGAGLAQWTSTNRRRGLFAHEYNGQTLGADILFDMDAQVDYLDEELRTAYTRAHSVVNDATVTVEDASDEIVYNFEVPGSILDNGTKLARTDPRVQQTFGRRREYSARALRAYQGGQQ